MGFELLEDYVAVGDVHQRTAAFVLLQGDYIPDFLLQFSGLDTRFVGPFPAVQLALFAIALRLQLIFAAELDVGLGDLLHEPLLAVGPQLSSIFLVHGG